MSQIEQPGPDDFEDAELDRRLTAWLGSQLDGQLGRAEACFARSGVSAPLCGRTSRSLRWAWLAVGAAAAAIALFVWQAGMLETADPPQAEAPPRDASASKQVADSSSSSPTKSAEKFADAAYRGAISLAPDPKRLVLDQSVQWRTLDEGIVMLDDRTPVRKLRRQRLERVQWFDAARGATLEMLVPHEEVVFVALPVH
jgi:hypothetical protein